MSSKKTYLFGIGMITAAVISMISIAVEGEDWLVNSQQCSFFLLVGWAAIVFLNEESREEMINDLLLTKVFVRAIFLNAAVACLIEGKSHHQAYHDWPVSISAGLFVGLFTAAFIVCIAVVLGIFLFLAVRLFLRLVNSRDDRLFV